MSSIDERIVILKFDNQDFEKNVAQSTKTLDKLKEKLKLDGATKGLEAVSASAKSFSFGSMGDAIDSIKARFSTLGVIGMTVIQNLTNKVTDFATKVGGQIISGGIRRAQNLEQANFMLEGLFGDLENKAEKVQEIMTAANDAVTGTAYGLDEAAKVASQLVASGIQDGDRMTYVLRGIAGTAAMTGGSYEELGNIFTTVAGSGKLMTEQLRQFEHRGLNVAAQLAKELNTTEAEIRDMVTDGAISFDMFANAMAEAFGDHAQEANKTFAGSLSNVKAALSRLGAKVATPELQNLRDIFNVLAPMIDAVSKALQPLIDLLNNGLKTATMRGVEALTNFFLAFGGDADTLVAKTEYMSDEAKEHMNATIAKFGETAEAGGNFFTKLREKITGTAEVVTGTADTMEEQAERIGMSAEEIDEYARRVIGGEFGNGETRIEQLEALGASFEEVQNRVNELLGCEKRYEVQTKKADKETNGLSKELDTAAAHAEKFGHNMSETAEETERVATPLQNLKDGLGNIVGNLKKIGGAIADAFASVFHVEDFTGAVSKLAEGFYNLTEKTKLTDDAAVGIKTIFEGLFAVVKGGLWALGKLLSLATKAAGLIGKGIVTVLDKLGKLRTYLDNNHSWNKFWDAIYGVAVRVKEAFIDFKDKVVEVATAIKNSEGFQKLQSTLEKLWEIVKQIASDVLDRLVEKLKEIGLIKPDFSWLETIANFISGAAGKLADFIQSFIDGNNPIQTFFANFKEQNTGKFGKFVDLLVTAKDAVVQFFSGLFSGGNGNSVLASAGSSGLSEWFTNFFSELFSNATEYVKGLSGSQLFGKVKEFFLAVLEQLDEVDWEKVIGVLSQVAKAIAYIVFLKKTFQMLSSITQVFDSAKGALDKMGEMFTGIKGFFTDTEWGLPSLIKAYRKNSQAKLILSAVALIAAVAGSLYVLSKIPYEDLANATEALLLILGSVALILAAVEKMSMGGQNMKNFGIAMAGLGAGVGLLALTASKLSKLDDSAWHTGALRVLELVAMLAIAARVAGQVKAAAAFMGMAVAIDLLIPAILILGHLEWSTILKAAAALGMVMAEISFAVGAIGGQVKAAAAFMGLAFAIDLLVPALLIIGHMEWEQIWKGVIALGSIMFSLAGAIRLASSPVSSKGGRNMLAMTVPLIAAIVGLKLLADIPWQQLLAAAAAMVGVVMGLALALKFAKGGGKGAKNMLAMTVPLVAAIVGLAVLARLPIKNVLLSAVALGGVMLALAGALKLAGSSRGNKLSQGAKNMLAMTVPLAAAAAGLYFLATLPIKNILAAALALGGVMVALGLVVKYVSTVATKEGMLMVLAMTVPLGVAAYALYQLAQFPWQNVLAAAVSMGIVFLALSASIAILSAVPFLAGLKAIGLMAILFAAIVAAVAVMGYLFGEGGKFEGVMKKAIPVMEDLGTAIGGFVASLITTINEGVSSSLERFGEAIGNFGESIGPFIEAAKTIDQSVLEGVGNLVLCLLEVTGAEFLDALASGFGLTDSSMERFGKQLVTFGAYLSHFSTQVDPAAVQNAVDGASIAIGMYSGLKGSGIFGGVIGWFQGGMGGGPLKRIGKELAAFADTTSGIKTSNKTVVKNVAEASTAAIEAYGSLKGKSIFGGVLGFFQSGIGGSPLKRIGTELKSFSEETSGIKNSNKTVVKNVAEAAAASIEAYGALKGKSIFGGVLGVFQSGIGGSPLKKIASGLKDFADEAQDIKNVKTGIIRSISAVLPDAVTALKAADEADIKEGNVSDFGAALSTIGGKISTFSSNCSSILTGKMQSVAKVVPDLVTMLTAMSNASVSNAESTASTLVNVGGKIKTFAENVAGVSSSQLSAVSGSVAQIAAMQKSVDTASTSISSNLGSSMTTAAKTAVSNLTSGLSGGSGSVAIVMGSLVSPAIKILGELPAKFKQYGTQAASDFVSGLKGGGNSAYIQALSLAAFALKGVSSGLGRGFANAGREAVDGFLNALNRSSSANYAGGKLGTEAINGLKNNIGGASGVGHDVVSGFASGMRSNAWIAAGAAAKVASDAIEAAKAKFNINSPSKVFIGIGESVVEGLTMGINSGKQVVKNASENLANAAINAAKTPTKAFQNAIDFNLDMNPTITPVLDLSEIEAGAGRIGNLINSQTPQLAFAGAGAYNNLMAIAGNRMPASDNGDVIHAINGLKGEIGSTVFNITVDGTESPEEFADKLVRMLRNRSRN